MKTKIIDMIKERRARKIERYSTEAAYMIMIRAIRFVQEVKIEIGLDEDE